MRLEKRVFCLFLAAVMCFSLLPLSALAAEDSEPALESDVSVEGTNAVGGLLANTLDGAAEDGQAGPASVTDITVDEKTAAVELSTTVDATLVVAVYTEDGAKLLGSGITAVTPEDEAAEVEIEIDAMPAYYVIGAYLLDAETRMPLCDEYLSRMYTEQFQDFLATTVDDYDADRVVNLDDDKTTNFVVFGEDTVLADAETQITDNGDGTYTITNADESFLTMQPGDSFTYTYDDGTMLIVVAKDVRVDGTTVTVTDDADATLEDVFDYVKIDGTSDGAEITVDTSGLDEDVQYLGMSEEEDAPQLDGAWEREASFKHSLSFSVDKTWDKSGKYVSGSGAVKGSFTYSFSVKLKAYIAKDWQYVKQETKHELKVAVDFEGKGSLSVPLAVIGVSPVPGVYITITPSFVTEFSVKLSFNSSLSFSSGFEYDSDTDTDKKPLSTSPKLKAGIEVEGSLFIGLEVEAAFTVISEKTLKFSLTVKGGAEAKAKQKIAATGDSEQHMCAVCLDGDIYGKLSINLKLKIFNGLVKTNVSLLNLSAKITDFYWSLTYGEFGWGICPHIAYKTTVTVTDENGKPVEGAVIGGTGLDKDPTTDKDGVAVFYLPNGEYDLTVTKDSLSATKSTTVHNGTKKLEIKLTASPGGSGVDLTDEEIEKLIAAAGAVVDSGQCGDDVYWTLYENGLMVISGTGEMYDYTACTTEEYDDSIFVCPWYAESDSIKTIVIENGVTSIGEWAFMYCENLVAVNIPDSVTSIGGWALLECASLAKVTFGNSVTDIGNMAFQSCASLASIDIPASVTSIGSGAFADCTGLTKVTIPNIVTSIGGWAFSGCTGLAEVTIPDSVTSIGDGAFSGCTSLTSVTIPDSVTSIGDDAFCGCTGLTSVTIPDSVMYIGHEAFLSCTSLASIDIPASVKIIGSSAFERCESLTSIDIPDSVTSIGREAFECCTNLVTARIGNSVKSIDIMAFLDCTSLSDLYYAGSEDAWNSISGISDADIPDTAVIHFNSTGPGTDGASEPSPEDMPGPAPDALPSNDPIPSDDVILADPVAAWTGAVTAEGVQRIAAFSGLVPGARYVLLVMSGEELTPDNLLFIAQGRAEDDGTLSFSYIPREDIEGADATAYGANYDEISDDVYFAVIILKASIGLLPNPNDFKVPDAAAVLSGVS